MMTIGGITTAQVHEWVMCAIMWVGSSAAARTLFWSAVAATALGAILLLFGIRVARLLLTVSFVGLGAAIGSSLGMVYRSHLSFVPRPEWSAAIAGAVILGLVGFLLYRWWLVLTFGAFVALLAAGGYTWMTERDKIADCGRKLVSAYRDLDTLDKDPQRLLPQNLSAEDRPGEIQKKAEQIVAQWCDVKVDTYKAFARRAIGLSLASLVGLVVGLLIAGFAFRLSVVLLTSVCGVTMLASGLMALAYWKMPGAFGQVLGMGPKALIGVGGAWLVGVAVQAALARRRKPAAQQGIEQPNGPML